MPLEAIGSSPSSRPVPVQLSQVNLKQVPFPLLKNRVINMSMSSQLLVKSKRKIKLIVLRLRLLGQ